MSEDFIQQLKNGHEGKCPCCGRFAKVYHRKVHTSTALQLIELYKRGGDRDFIHASKLIPQGVTGTGDFTKAKYWGLITEQAPFDDDKKASGSWMLTALGVNFVKNEAKIQKYAAIYDDRVLYAHGPLVSIEECVQEKFCYKDLMEGV